MNALEKQNSLLIREADRLLNECGLLRIVSKYGTPFLLGSYVLRLMTWRDLDINIEFNDLSEKQFFKMGGEIASALKPWRMSFRNEIIKKTPGLPLGFYYGVHTFILGGSEEWKIDIWTIDADQVAPMKKELAELQAGINETNRNAILEIKNQFCKHPEYHVGIHSLDIYTAVMKNGIKTPAQFSKWVKATKGIDLSDESPSYSRVLKEGR